MLDLVIVERPAWENSLKDGKNWRFCWIDWDFYGYLKSWAQKYKRKIFTDS